MPRFVAKLWDLVADSFGKARQAVPYQLTCTCGQAVSGSRQARHQVVRCPACQEELFVLPLSPLPPVPGTDPPPSSPPSRRRQWPLWLLPVAAALIGLLGAAAVVLVLLSHAFWMEERNRSATAPAGPEALRARLGAGEQALTEGNFQRSVAEFAAARRLWDRNPAALDEAEQRRLTQGHRQAALLSELLSEPLEQLLGQAAGLEAQEWQKVFERRYKDRAFIFDTRVRREPNGNYVLPDHHLLVGEEPVRLDLGNLALLHRLPLQDPQRLVFGARLASAGREAMGEWVLRVEPDSGVLLTSAGAITACSSIPLDDDLRAVLVRQESWLADLGR